MPVSLIKEGYKWDLQNHEEWLLRIKKELKSDTLSDSLLHIDKDIIYDPYKQSENNRKINLINHFPYLSICSRLHLTNAKADNKFILKLLANDLRVIRLSLDRLHDWNELFDNIKLDLITLIVEVDNDKIAKSLDQFVQSHFADANIIWINSLQDSNNASLSYLNYSNLSKAELFYNICHDVSVLKEENIYIELSVTEHILEIIPFLRAVRIMVEKRYPNKNLEISATIEMKDLTDNNDESIIRSGSVSLLCAMAGADFLFFDKTTTTNESDFNHQRLLLNIQNIMELESKTNLVKDPLSGSYIIEDITNQYLNLKT